jgi:hypothetical protein
MTSQDTEALKALVALTHKHDAPHALREGSVIAIFRAAIAARGALERMLAAQTQQTKGRSMKLLDKLLTDMRKPPVELVKDEHSPGWWIGFAIATRIWRERVESIAVESSLLAAAPVASQRGEPVALPKVIEEVCFTLRADTAYQRIGDYKLADKLEAAFSGREGPVYEQNIATILRQHSREIPGGVQKLWWGRLREV